MLKPMHEVFSLTGLPEGAMLLEPAVCVPTFFSGVDARVIDGIAHLLFFVEQPSCTGCTGSSETEYVIVARMAAPEMRATFCLANAATRIAKGPHAIERRSN